MEICCKGRDGVKNSLKIEKEQLEFWITYELLNVANTVDKSYLEADAIGWQINTLEGILVSVADKVWGVNLDLVLNIFPKSSKRWR